MDRLLMGRDAPYIAGGPKKRTTDELPALDVRELKRKNLIRPGREKLKPFTQGAEPVRLTWEPCGFGEGDEGPVRPWFICPGTGCRRRVAILYLEDKRLLLCRHCLELVYPSQRETELQRLKRRADAARAKLGPDENPRPRGMHKRTFLRLCGEYVDAREEQKAMEKTEALKFAAKLLR